MAKKGKKRKKVYLEFGRLSDADFEVMQLTEEDLKASAAEFDKMLKESEKDLKNLFEGI